jgi:hypothetical protein
MLTTVVFVIQRGSFLYNHTFIFYLSLFFFVLSLTILFVNKVYNKRKFDQYVLGSLQKGEEDFTSQLGQYRREK